MENIYSTDVQVSFEIYGHFRYLHVLYSKKIIFTKYCLAQWISKLPPELWNPLSKAVPGKFDGSVRHSKHKCLQNQDNVHRPRAWLLSQFLTLLMLNSTIYTHVVDLCWLLVRTVSEFTNCFCINSSDFSIPSSQPLPEPMLTHHRGRVAFAWG